MSARLRALGVVQFGSPVLRAPARPVVLPLEQATTWKVADQLFAVLSPVSRLGRFHPGWALTAPQLGIGRAIAVVLPADRGGQADLLINPRITARSPETSEEYERCLSFADLHGRVPRADRVTVESLDLDGTVTASEYRGGASRMVQHAVDHLDGLLYLSRMRPGVTTTLAPILTPPVGLT